MVLVCAVAIPCGMGVMEATKFAANLVRDGEHIANLTIQVTPGEYVALFNDEGTQVARWRDPGSLAVERTGWKSSMFRLHEFGELLGTLEVTEAKAFRRTIAEHVRRIEPSRASKGADTIPGLVLQFVTVLAMWGYVLLSEPHDSFLYILAGSSAGAGLFFLVRRRRGLGVAGLLSAAVVNPFSVFFFPLFALAGLFTSQIVIGIAVSELVTYRGKGWLPVVGVIAVVAVIALVVRSG